MKLYTFLQIGTFHTNHCEDYLITADIGQNRLLCAVMDGCTMGTDSYLAATLTGKILRKIAKTIYYQEFVGNSKEELKPILKKVMHELFAELAFLQNRLQLETDELLSTLLVSIIDSSKREGEAIIVGDGVICINGQLIEYDHDNKPDYLGYHLTKDFEKWYAQHKQKLSLHDLKDLSLVTDGIFTFQPFDNKVYETQQAEALISWLLHDTKGIATGNLLKKKMLHIEKEWGLKPTDDLAMIRLIF